RRSFDIAVTDRDLDAHRLQARGKLPGEDDRPMTSAGAADGDVEPATAVLVGALRRPGEQRDEPVDELTAVGLVEHVGADSIVEPGEHAQLRLPEGVAQEPG